jgi:transposase
MLTVGLDVHHRTSSICVLNQDGKVVKESRLRGGFDDVVSSLAGLAEPFRVCYEASTGYGALHDRLAPIAQRVVVAHPGQVRLIFKSKKKNDRVDAKKLATLMFLDQIPTVHVPSMNVRAWRRLIEARRGTVDKQTRVKNGIRSILRSYAVAAPRALWTAKGRVFLVGLELPTPQARLELDLLIEELDSLGRMLKRMTQELDRIARGHPGVRLLRTIPGVGARTAEAFAAYVDDPSRFRKSKCIGSYFGMVPSQDQSAFTDRRGHITKEGPATVRKYITEAAWRAIKLSPTVGAFYQRVLHEDPQRNRIALIATAHHLLRVMLAMLKTGEVWRSPEEKTCSGKKKRAGHAGRKVAAVTT